MTYRVELAASAKADIRGQARWLCDNITPAAAEKWLDGLYKAIDTLQTRPLRCPFASESERFPEATHVSKHKPPPTAIESFDPQRDKIVGGPQCCPFRIGWKAFDHGTPGQDQPGGLPQEPHSLGDFRGNSRPDLALSATEVTPSPVLAARFDRCGRLGERVLAP